MLSQRPIAQAMNPLAKRTIAINFVNTELKMEVRDPHVEWELRHSGQTLYVVLGDLIMLCMCMGGRHLAK